MLITGIIEHRTYNIEHVLKTISTLQLPGTNPRHQFVYWNVWCIVHL